MTGSDLTPGAGRPKRGERMTKPTINMEVSLGNLLLIASIAVSVVVFLVKGDERGTSTARAVDGFESRLTRELAEVRGAIDALRLVVNPIGVLNQRVEQAERRVTDGEGREAARDARINGLAEAVAFLRARDAGLPPARQVRP